MNPAQAAAYQVTEADIAQTIQIGAGTIPRFLFSANPTILRRLL